MQESGENYLETILMLKKKNGTVRSVDIARELGFSKPSVSRAVGILRDQGYLVVEPSGELKLTEEGNRVAGEIYGRHQLLTAFLQQVAGVSAEEAEDNACRMEHVLSQPVVDGIRKFMQDMAAETGGKY